MSDWHDIPGYPGFQITRDGRVRSIKRNRELLLVQNISKWGYPSVQVRDEQGRNHVLAVHRLVMKTFNPDPEPHRHIIFINGDKTDVRFKNLEYLKKSDIHSEYECSKLTPQQIEDIRARFANAPKLRSVADEYNVSHETIRKLLKSPKYGKPIRLSRKTMENDL